MTVSRADARQRVYLDHNATAPLRPEARMAAIDALGAAANPSSVHAEGRRARRILEDARTRVGALVGAPADHVTFTSGATEAAGLALAPDLSSRERRSFSRLVVGATEHAAVLNGHRFPDDTVAVLPVTSTGVIDLTALADLLEGREPAVVAVQAANNETGVLQPLGPVADAVRRTGGVLVCDAVQAAGRIACDALPADVVLLSAHKMGGLAGAGAVVLLRNDLALGRPMVRGGGQERGRRAGTENVAAIAAFGAAASAADPAREGARLAALCDRLEEALIEVCPEAFIFGHGAPRLPNTLAFAIPGLQAERLLIALDLAGVAVSSGSACASGVVGRSHVLEAMGVPPDLRSGAIRFSLGWDTTQDDVDRAIDVLVATLQRQRGRRPIAAVWQRIGGGSRGAGIKL